MYKLLDLSNSLRVDIEQLLVLSSFHPPCSVIETDKLKWLRC